MLKERFTTQKKLHRFGEMIIDWLGVYSRVKPVAISREYQRKGITCGYDGYGVKASFVINDFAFNH
jgi:hypothetical protein